MIATAPPRPSTTPSARAIAQKARALLAEHGHDRTTQLVIPRQLVTHAVRAASGPTASPPRRETRHRPGGRRARPCGGRRSSDRTRGPCRKTGPADRGRSRRSETARTRPRASRTSESPGTPAPRSGAVLPRRADSRPACERFRSDRARSGRADPARDAAVRRSSRARPRETSRRAPCQREPDEIGLNANARERHVAHFAMRRG